MSTSGIMGVLLFWAAIAAIGAFVAAGFWWVPLALVGAAVAVGLSAIVYWIFK